MQPHPGVETSPTEGNPALVDLRVDVNGGVAVVSVVGELDFFTSVPLADQLARAVASDSELTVVDLSNTSFVSLSAFRVLSDAADLVARRGGLLVLRDAPASVRILGEALAGTAGTSLVIEASDPATHG